MRFAVRAWSALLALAALTPRAAASEVAPAAPAPAEGSPAPPTATLPANPPAPAPAPSRWDWALLPLVLYAPETSLGAAFGIGIYDDTPAPPDRPRRDDSASLLLQGTLKKQVVVAFSGVKFWHAGREQLTEDVSLVDFPNVFWGVGNDTPESARDLFTQSLGISRTSFAVRLPGETYVGAGAAAGWYRTSGGTTGGAVEAYGTAVPTRGPAIGVGPLARRDTRDDALGPHRGSLTSLSATFFPGFLGSTYHFQQYEFDQRTYLGLGGRTVLAMEAYGLYAPGTVPLAELPALGGSSRLRGYFQGRFRDHLYLMGQLEARIRIVGRFSVAPFGGVGNVFGSPSDVSFDRTKVAGGLSVRFRVKKERELNVHIDAAKSPISSGIYLNMGEAF
ncbi:MAG TPA: BamA/TamA family outer membrane protein [Polyangia bacterium]|nr:BamA/TamA family outer membrane protein [Polyangia bacterium]